MFVCAADCRRWTQSRGRGEAASTSPLSRSRPHPRTPVLPLPLSPHRVWAARGQCSGHCCCAVNDPKTLWLQAAATVLRPQRLWVRNLDRVYREGLVRAPWCLDVFWGSVKAGVAWHLKGSSLPCLVPGLMAVRTAHGGPPLGLSAWLGRFREASPGGRSDCRGPSGRAPAHEGPRRVTAVHKFTEGHEPAGTQAAGSRCPC